MHIFKWRIGTLQTDFSWNAHAACRDDRIKVQRTEDNGRKKMLNRKNGKEKCNKNGNEWMEISALTRKNNNIWCALFSDLFPPHCFTELCRAFFCMCRYFSLMSFVCWKISTQSWLFFCRLLLLSISLYTFNVYHIEQLHIVWRAEAMCESNNNIMKIIPMEKLRWIPEKIMPLTMHKIHYLSRKNSNERRFHFT